jgi:hypothetical protein
VLAGLWPAARAGICIAIQPINVTSTDSGPIKNQQSGTYAIQWTETVTWACSGGNPPGCIVCLMDIASISNGQTYVPQFTLQSQEGPMPCNQPDSQAQYVGQWQNIQPNQSCLITLNYKVWQPNSDCSNAVGYQLGASIYFHTGS